MSYEVRSQIQITKSIGTRLRDYAALDHSDLIGKHAILAPSKCKTWKNEDNETSYKRILGENAKIIGTLMHEYSAKMIRNLFKFTSKSEKKHVLLYLTENGIPKHVLDSIDFDFMYSNMTNYVNDAVGFGMIPELPLYFCDTHFGTVDAITFNDKENLLRIHDLKTGVTPASMDQLIDYAALFCFQFGLKPYEFNIELRIYQNNEVLYHNPTPEEIGPIMDKAISFDKFYKSVKREV